LIRDIAATREVLFVVHPPTVEALARHGLESRVEHPGVTVQPLLPHSDFARHLSQAPFVVTDGGSIQEECALLGIPTLLWRDHTEREDGLGANVVLSRFDEDMIADFLDNPARFRRDAGDLALRPSAQIVDYLQERWG
jgi:UDP-N-acetylglucosamine 2-epimerase (non-hydrolysing)